MWLLAIGNQLDISKGKKRIIYPAIWAYSSYCESGILDDLASTASDPANDDRLKREPNPNWASTDDEVYDIRRARRTSSLNVLHEDPQYEGENSLHEDKSTTLDVSYETGGEAALDSVDKLSTELQPSTHTTSEPGDDVRLSDDYESFPFDADQAGDFSKVDPYLRKVIEEDILRTLPSLCVFQVSALMGIKKHRYGVC